MTQIVDADADRIEPPHDPDDSAKLDEIAESMQANGWIGAPVMVIDREGFDPLAVTGSHRIAAARRVGIEIPTVNLADLLAEHGANLAEMIADREACGIDPDTAIYEAAIHAVDHLPVTVVDHFGLDLH